MKAIAAHPVPSIERVGNGVQVGVVGKRGVKGCIEDGRLGTLRAQGVSRRNDATQVVRIVQWREVDGLFDLPEHGLVDDDRVGEPLAAVHDPVSDSVDLLQPRKWASCFLVHQPLQDRFGGLSMIADGSRASGRRPGASLEVEHCLSANPVDHPSRQPLIGIRRHPFGISPNELELQ
jgi:hypothetical protein